MLDQISQIGQKFLEIQFFLILLKHKGCSTANPSSIAFFTKLQNF